MSLPSNFKIIGVDSQGLLVTTVHKLVSEKANPTAFVSQNSNLLQKIGYRGKPPLLRVMGSEDAVVQNAIGLLAAEYLKDEFRQQALISILTKEDLDSRHLLDSLIGVLRNRQILTASA